MTVRPNAELFNLLRELPREEIALAISELGAEHVQAILYDWGLWARGDQVTPGNVNPRTEDGTWTNWLTLAGRGWGKTRTGAETVRGWVKQGFRYVNLIGATVDDARDIMIEGESGILAICPKHERPRYIGNKRQLIWPNGVKSLVFTADEPERLRGKQHEKLWADELAAWRYPEAWDQAKFGLRLGDEPQAFISTTPRPFKIIKDLIADPYTLVTRGTTYDNRANLASAFFRSIIRMYEGTRLGQQELNGIVLDDNPNALFSRANIDAHRRSITLILELLMSMDRIVVAIDPAVTADEDSDESGIIVAGVRTESDDLTHAYVFDDASDIYKPKAWADKVIGLYNKYHGDHVVAEVNNGGDMVTYTIQSVDENVPVRTVHASRGKAIRAEPIAALYEQGRVHHVGTFGKLEDQMCDWEPTDKNAKSPDRMDALVWAITDLMVGAGETGILSYLRTERRALDADKDTAQREEAKAEESDADKLLRALSTYGANDDADEESD
jgi:phage terminase large subunit-like protein